MLTPDHQGGVGPVSGERSFRLDSSYRRPGAGTVIIGGSPLRLFRLTAAGVAVAAAIERGTVLPAHHPRLTSRLVVAGAIHPVLAAESIDPSRLTIVIPCRDELPRYATTRCRVVVVDDASTPPLHLARVARAQDDIVIRLDRNVGPGGARNAGLAAARTEFVAFVDSDVFIDDESLLHLATHLSDPAVALVAPRIRADPGDGTLARYEQRHSPLDMGGEAARITPATRVSYVPAAVVVCRTDAVRAIGGFDADLRYGEDVDLVWRLGGAGWQCRYEPEVVALHATRRTLREWAMQRFHYGTAAAALARRHAGSVAPLRMSGWSAATWLPVATGIPLLGIAIGAGSAALLTRKLDGVPKREALRIAGIGNLYAGRLIASALTRAWWPLLAVLALVSPRARRVLAAAVLVPAFIDWHSDRPPIDLLRSLGLRVLDDVAYGTGVWAGALRQRHAGALLPSFVSWPGRGDTPGHGPGAGTTKPSATTVAGR